MICLTMIVKNESKTIIRLLTSVLPIVNCYCICDTGSTDTTVELIEEFVKEHAWTGKIVYKEFVNFEVNRNFALKQARTLNSDYLLLLDADMVLKIDKVPTLTEPAYSLKQCLGSLEYVNTRLVSSKETVQYYGVTHEYIDITGPTLEGIWIEDIGDGGSKSNKVDRDIELLEKGLHDDPTNIRYMFYLANSYKHQYVGKAISMYLRRIQAGGWCEEVFYSYLELGHCYKIQNNYASMIKAWLDGWNYRPTRAETLYELIVYYKEQKQYELCHIFYDIAINIPYPKDRLFVHKDIYTYKLYYEYSLFAFYSLQPKDYTCYAYLMNTSQLSLEHQMNNYKFYVPTLEHTKNFCFSDKKEVTVHGSTITFYASTPSIVSWKGGYLMNVNYKTVDNKIYTVNNKLELDKDFNILKEELLPLDMPTMKEYIYYGLQDIKLHVYEDTVYFLASHNNHYMTGEYGKDSSILQYKDLPCEKNWVYIPNSLDIIYAWNPLQYGHIEGNQLVITGTKKYPRMFDMARGSTNGYAYEDEYWFVVHFIDNERNYYHSVIRMDQDMNLVAYTLPFKFTKNPIEYCLGMIVKETEIILSYSSMEHSSMVSFYPKSTFRWLDIKN